MPHGMAKNKATKYDLCLKVITLIAIRRVVWSEARIEEGTPIKRLLHQAGWLSWSWRENDRFRICVWDIVDRIAARLAMDMKERDHFCLKTRG